MVQTNRIENQDNVTVRSSDIVSDAVLCEAGKVSSLCKFFLQVFLQTDSTIYQFNTVLSKLCPKFIHYDSSLLSED